MQIKVCGLKEPDNIRAAADLGVDLMGFIFYPPSKRYMAHLAPEVLQDIPKQIIKVGVFVDEHTTAIEQQVARYGLNAVQLHGDEPPEVCRHFKTQDLVVIKSFGVTYGFDFQSLEVYASVCDYLLFDTKSPQYGGTGKKYDWQILLRYTSQTPFFLSGGIEPQDANVIKTLDHLNMVGVDLNSRFEIEPGLKDIHKLKYFIETIKQDD